MEVIRKNIVDYLYEIDSNRLNMIAFESLGGKKITYSEFFEMAEMYAKAFLSIGVKNGDIVTVVTAGTLDTVLYFAGLNKIGAVIQFVNPNYLKFNSKKYIDQTGSKVLICMDRFYPLIKDAIAETNVSQIIIASLSEYMSSLYKLIIRKKSIKKADQIAGIKYYDLKSFLKQSSCWESPVETLSYEKDKPAIITYTSGTTGDPKGVVHSNDSMNNMITIYQLGDGFGLREKEKNLVIIPPMYLTSFVHSIIGPMSLGGHNILQPIYNPKTLDKDLKKYKPKIVVASKSHYINLADSKLKKGSLSKTKFAYCGGEAISQSLACRINEILDYHGIDPLVLGYGQTEFGTMTMFNYNLPDRTNESGILIPEIRAKIVDFQTGEEVPDGTRGELWIQTPAVMKEYLYNKSATDAFFTKDKNGEVWARTGDVAEVKRYYNNKAVYEVSGRVNDSFVDEEGNTIYLFDIETKAEELAFVREAEAIAITVEGKMVPIVHVVLEHSESGDEREKLILLDNLIKESVSTASAIPYAYKLRESFSTSPISGKRNYEILQYETDGYYVRNKDGSFDKKVIVSEESKIENQLLQSNIMVR